MYQPMLDEEEDVPLNPGDKSFSGGVGLLAVAMLIIVCTLSSKAQMTQHDMVYAISTQSRGYIHGKLYSTPAEISLQDSKTSFFQVRILMSAIGKASPDSSLARPARKPDANSLTMLSEDAVGPSVNGNFTYSLLVDGKNTFRKTVDMHSPHAGLEEFQDVNLADLHADQGKEYKLEVACNHRSGHICPFAVQVVQMSALGAFRIGIGFAVLLFTLVGICAEKIHRVYIVFLGVIAALCTIGIIQEVLSLNSIVAMIDFPPLMQIFSMMILTSILQETGFFDSLAAKVVWRSKGNPKALFFALTYLSGILSMLMDSVTAVMLLGPFTFTVATRMKFNPRYCYLSMAICASIGSAGTLTGSMENLIIGSKLSIGYNAFLLHNGSLIVFVCLPAASSFLYWKLKGLTFREGVLSDLDTDELVKTNRISDLPKFSTLAPILLAMHMGYLLTPVHKLGPAWFSTIAMLTSAMWFQCHNCHHYLMRVEWDTLLYYSGMFCIMGSMSCLGAINILSGLLKGAIVLLPEGPRAVLAILASLWLPAFVSALVDSSFITMLVVYVLQDMKQQKMEGFNPDIMALPLSLAINIGSIGTIMGSSANLVSMAISNRKASAWDQKIQGGDFIKHGMPTMVLVLTICTIWQISIFTLVGTPV